MKTTLSKPISPRIAVVGTVGVPARYGGFETLAEQLAFHVSPRQAALTFYCQHSAYPELVGQHDLTFQGHRRVLIPLSANGPVSMAHDVLAMLHTTLVERADAMLVLGYSGAWALPLIRLLRPSMRIVTNIDGMEWRRGKFGAGAKWLLRWLESMAVRHSDVIVADNAALVQFARSVYPDLDPLLIAYGGDHTIVPADKMPIELADSFYLSIARIEPENNCHVILEAFNAADNSELVFVGNWAASPYGRELKVRYAGNPRIHMLDPIYQQSVLASLRAKANGYVHGHSVGGTNPSLVEALFHTCRVLAFDCAFNRSTLDDHGAYFSDAAHLCELLRSSVSQEIPADKVRMLRDRYRWDAIAQEYMSACQT
jgi:glycosyltransferase involved in cell wall biosynthesis